MSGAAGRPWSDVAAPGTDPELLARIVRRAASDPKGLSDAITALTRNATPVARALRTAADEPVLDVAEGDECATRWAALGITVALAGDRGMPSRLAHLTAPPLWLAMAGGPVAVDGPAVALVGSRRASDYGKSMASWLARSVAEFGVRVVSGGAVGIDAASHAAALDTPGTTTVVLGCGHGVDYPRAHARPGSLFDQVMADGGSIVSEALPTEPPRPWRVRARNRLIAGLADVVVVVEGGPRSGSLITASWAADHGQQVLAVPGDARADGSAAPLALLRDGAGVCATPDDLFAALSLPTSDGVPDPSAPAATGLATIMPGAAADTLAQAWPRSVTLSQLAERSGVAVGALMAAVTAAQVAGLVTRDLDGLRLCRKPGGVDR